MKIYIFNYTSHKNKNLCTKMIYYGRITYRFFKDRLEPKYEHDQAIYTLNYRGWTTLNNGNLIVRADIEFNNFPKTINGITKEYIISTISQHRRDKIINNILK